MIAQYQNLYQYDTQFVLGLSQKILHMLYFYFFVKKSLWTTANNTNVLYFKKKKKSLKMFTQITYITNLIKLILSSQVTSVHII